MSAASVRAANVRAARFLALGDSYTIGEGVEPAERWPVQLARALRARGLDIADPDIVARTGWATDELAAGIAVAAPAGPYALVSLLIGVNNQYRGGDAGRFRDDLVSLLAQAVVLAGGDAGRVLVLSIPDWSVTPFAAGRDRASIAGEIDRFNAICRDAALRVGARHVDVTAASREERDGWVTSDGLHPTGRHYARWVELSLADAERALQG